MTLTVAAWAGSKPRPVVAAKAAARALELLAQLSDFQQYLKQSVLGLPRCGRRPAVVERAVTACRRVALASGQRLTPLAAVAGSVADEVTDAAWGLGTDKVVVNNGGDLALRLAPGRRRAAPCPDPPAPALAYLARVNSRSSTMSTSLPAIPMW